MRDSDLTHLKLHVSQTIMEGTRVLVKRKCASFANNTYFGESFDEPGGKSAFKMGHSFLYFFLLVRNETANVPNDFACIENRSPRLKSDF